MLYATPHPLSLYREFGSKPDGRSLTALIAGQDFQAKSAGIHPVGLNPMSVTVMDELGMDIRAHRSKSVSEVLGQSFDYVITVCDRAKESCPVFPGPHQVLHWPLDDPAAAPPETRLDEFRRVRDEIADRLCTFLVKECKLVPAAMRCYRC